MASHRLLSWSLNSAALVPLVPLGVGGGESAIYVSESDPNLLAAVPNPGGDAASYFRKASALIPVTRGLKNVAAPQEILVLPKDKTTPVAFTMDRVPGKGLDELFFPAERTALGLDWGREEWAAVGVLLARLFAATEHYGITQNDTHPGNYLIDFCPKSGRPLAVSRVDAMSFGFWHKGTYHGPEKCQFEYLCPSLQWLGRRPQGLKGYQMPREADRGGLGYLLFEMMTGGKHCEYVGGEPDPARRVEKKEFAVLSTPPGAKVPDEVEAAYYGLPVELTALFERALLGDPLKRPTPAEWIRALKAVSRPRPTMFLPRLDVATALGRTARWARASARKYAAGLVGTAAMAGAVLLLPGAGTTPTAETAPVGPQAVAQQDRSPPAPARSQAAGPQPDQASLPDIPAPPRRAKNPDGYHTLNAK